MGKGPGCITQTKVCMHQYVGVSTRSTLRNFGVKANKSRWPKQGKDRKCLFTEVNTIKCVNSLYLFSHWAQKMNQQAYLGDFFFFPFVFKISIKNIFTWLKTFFQIMSITHPSFLSSLSMHQISCIHPQMKMFLWQLWDPSPYIKGPRGAFPTVHQAVGRQTLVPGCGFQVICESVLAPLDCSLGAPREH